MQISENFSNIFEALCKFRGEVANPKKDKTNPHFKSEYASLDSIITTVNPVLSQCGLSFFQDQVNDKDGYVGVYTMIIHKAGEWIKFNPVYIKAESAHPQKLGAALTYAKRYSLSMALGIATDDDDDANSISPQNQNKAQQRPVKKQEPKPQPSKPAAHKQGHGDLTAFEDLANENKKQSNPGKRYWAIADKKGFAKDDLNVLIWGAYRVDSHTKLDDKKFNILADYLDKIGPEKFNLTVDCFRQMQEWELEKEQQQAVFFYIGGGKTDWRAFSVKELNEAVEFLKTASQEEMIRTVDAMREAIKQGAA